ncbi:MAG: hypothetical protein U1E59_13135 [Amaricoccus sp.]
MQKAAGASDFTTPREIRDWRSFEIARVRRMLAEKVRVLRLELESEAARLPRHDLLRSDALLFGRFVRARVKPELDAAAAEILEAAGKDLRDKVGSVAAAEGVAPVKAGFADRLASIGVAPEVTVPALGFGFGLYLVFAAITTASSWLVFRRTNVSMVELLAGVAIVAGSTFLFLTSLSRVRTRKRKALLRRFDAYVDSEVTPRNPAAGNAALEPRLVAAIRRQAEELEAGLGDA